MRPRSLIQALPLAILVALALAAPAHAAFPGANGRIAFAGRVAPDPYTDIYTVNPDGSSLVNLTNSAAVAEFDPASSPDGERIVYQRQTAVSDSELWMMNADGTDQHPLGTLGLWPTWSSDGTKIAFAGPVVGPIGGIGYSGLWLIGADGSDPHRIAPEGFQAAWAPDGSAIAVEISSRIYLLNPDGTGARRLIIRSPFESAGEVSPAWAPDSRKVVYNVRTEVGDEVVGDIAIVNRDGTGRVFLTNNTEADQFDAFDTASTPAWSSDGTKIVFVARTREFTSSLQRLYLVNLDGGDLASIPLPGGMFASDPDWQPLPGPRRADFKNAAHFCKAEARFLGEGAFREEHGGGANAFGKCVSGS